MGMKEMRVVGGGVGDEIIQHGIAVLYKNV